MDSYQVAKLTGYSDNTVRKYALILGVPCIGTGRRKMYIWGEADIARFVGAVRGADGRRDRRGVKKVDTCSASIDTAKV